MTFRNFHKEYAARSLEERGEFLLKVRGKDVSWREILRAMNTKNKDSSLLKKRLRDLGFGI